MSKSSTIAVLPFAARVLARLASGLESNAPRALANFASALGRAFFSEARCVACTAVFARQETSGEAGSLFCENCRAALSRREKGFCPHCGEMAAWPQLPLAPCARCLVEPPLWQALFCHGPHTGLLRHLVIRLKFQEAPLLGHALGSLLASHPGLETASIDCIIPVPLHKDRLALRGYNQALELARPLARSLGRPLQPRLLRRIRFTPPQVGTCREARKQNMLNAFAASREVSGGHVLLLDDTLTTGATLAAATEALTRAGASAVSVAVMSRTVWGLQRKAAF